MFCFNSFGSSRLHSILWRKEKVGKMIFKYSKSLMYDRFCVGCKERMNKETLT
jgi:hypothetical protein